ncbi:MAG: hypothetical protein IT307_18865 [Chloroflexi bacterium]|nr:hypothetical protein [Chloroflexota bacterium]
MSRCRYPNAARVLRQSVVLVTALAAAGLAALAPLAAPANSRVLLPVAKLSLMDGLSQADRQNVAVAEESIRLGDDPAFRLSDSRRFGVYVSNPRALAGIFDVVTAAYSTTGVGVTPELEVRSSVDSSVWSEWVAAAPGQPVSVAPGRVVQYRVTLTGDEDAPGGELRDLQLDLLASGADASPSPKNNPTARVFGTREGLVGRKTANGHTIVEKDRFVALPSRRALNPLDKTDYQVKVTYRGKSVVLPVWDVGPWNTRDNYWDDRRETWADLARFLPQAHAAWKNDYNDGRDQFGRWVTVPASIDIADGAFIDDLGMRNSDWVDVTFLWVDADSPSRPEYPPVLGLKPEPKPAGPPPDGMVWYFAEGSTVTPFQTWFHIWNPNPEPAKATFTLMMSDGSTATSEVILEAQARTSVDAKSIAPNAEFSTRVDATRPVMIERAEFFRRDGHASVGTTSPATTWYLADGSSQEPYETWLLIQNPGASPAKVTLAFMRDNGEQVVKEVRLDPTARKSLFANELIPDSTFATKVVSDQPIVVERTVFLTNGGGDNVMAAPSLSRDWYFAEGSTADGQDCWITLANPGRSTAKATLRYLKEDGSTLKQTLKVGPTSRQAIRVRDQLPDARFGVAIESDQPIVAERAIYFGGDGNGNGTGAHASLGATDLSKSWYLPEGSTQSPFQTLLMVANPSSHDARLRIQVARKGGDVATREVDLGATTRLTLNLADMAPDAAVSTVVTADRGVVVERTMYFNDGTGGTNTLGIPR